MAKPGSSAKSVVKAVAKVISKTSAKVAAKVVAKATGKPVSKALKDQSKKNSKSGSQLSAKREKNPDLDATTKSKVDNRSKKKNEVAKKLDSKELNRKPSSAAEKESKAFFQEAGQESGLNEISKAARNVGSDSAKKTTPSVLSGVKTTSASVGSVPKVKVDRSGMTDEQIRWADLYEKNQKESVLNYDMKAKFGVNGPIVHKVLGWGYILSNENDRLEVLFQSGIKMLISNYSR